MTKLSENFTLEELTKSQEATRKNIVEQFSPSEAIIANLTTLCTKVLQPLRSALKQPLNVSSGYRCDRVNKGIGGAKGSQHTKGQAADIELVIDGVNKNRFLAKFVLDNKIIFDQMIIEFGTMDAPAWIHLSYDPDKKIQRGQILRVTEQGTTILEQKDI